jgi:hypothetical protein
MVEGYTHTEITGKNREPGKHTTTNSITLTGVFIPEKWKLTYT